MSSSVSPSYDTNTNSDNEGSITSIILDCLGAVRDFKKSSRCQITAKLFGANRLLEKDSVVDQLDSRYQSFLCIIMFLCLLAEVFERW